VRLITWNVNSIRQRLPRLLGVLGRHEPDIVCLQETKVADDAFPLAEVEALGYGAATFGQRSYNGVAILARHPIAEVARGFPGDPVPEEARVIAATVAGVRVIDVYVVNGKEVANPAYEVKLGWLDALTRWVSGVEDPNLVVTGDFNVTPTDLDVHDPAAWAGRNLASDPERERVRRLLDDGLTDLGRTAAGTAPGPFTFWDYRAGAFHRGWGLRIDLVLARPAVAARLRSVTVDRDERKPTAGEGKPSDHAPVIVDLDD